MRKLLINYSQYEESQDVDTHSVEEMYLLGLGRQVVSGI